MKDKAKDEVNEMSKDWTTEPHVWGRKGDPTTFMVSAEEQNKLLHELIGAAGEVALITSTQDSRIVRLGMAWRKWRNAGGRLAALAPTQPTDSEEWADDPPDMRKPTQPQPSTELKERAREFLKSWSHEPTPIPANATIGSGLWYSTQCTEQVMAAFASSIQEADRQQIEKLTLALAKEKARSCIGGDVFEANRNQHILHLSTELQYLTRSEKAEQQLAEARKEADELLRDASIWRNDCLHANAQLAEARAQSWISVKDRLPELGEWCLVVIGGITQRVASKRRQLDGELIGWEWFDSDADCAPADAVTHWQPIPEFAEPRAGRDLEGTK